MVSLGRPLLVAVTSVGLLLGQMANASAINQDTGSGLPVIHDNGAGGGGSPVSSTNGDCSYYANQDGFGGACNGETLEPVHTILHEEATPICWDEVIVTSELHYYGYTSSSSYHYYVHTCVHDVDRNRSAHNQPGMHIESRVITILNTAHLCENPPFTEDLTGHCVMQLDGPGEDFAAAIGGQRIPSIVVTPHPSTTVRTDQMTGFSDVALNDAGIPIGGETAHVTIGGVTLFARMDGGFKIYPYGPPSSGTQSPACSNGLPHQIAATTTNGTCEKCNGLTLLDADSTPDRFPDACWWQYPKSSHGQGSGNDAETYDFRAEADWTIYFQNGAGPAVPWTTVQRYDDLALPVFDVQSLAYG